MGGIMKEEGEREDREEDKKKRERLRQQRC
jgi:hypothetical protein